MSVALLLAQPSFIVDEAFEWEALGLSAQVYASPSQLAAVDARRLHLEGKFSPVPANGMVYSAHPKYYWVQFALENHSEQAKSIFIEVRNAHINNIQLFDYHRGREEMHASEPTGDHYAFSYRAIDHRYFVFKAELEPGERKDFLLSADKFNESIKIPIVLRSELNFYGNTTGETTAIGLYIGICCVIILCLLVFCVVSFDILRASLLVYVLGISLGVVSNTGLGMQFLWGDTALFNSLSRSLFSSVGIMALLVFAYYYFDMDKSAGARLSRLHRLLLIFFGLWWLAFDLYYYWVATGNPLQTSISIDWVQRGLLFLPLYLMGLSLYFVLYRYHIKYVLFFISNVGVIVGIAFLSLEELGLVKDVFLTEVVLLAALLVDFTTLTSIVAVGFYRIRTDNKRLATHLERAIVDGAKSFLEGQQIERTRLAVEIHDGASVRLAALKMRLSSLETNDLPGREDLLQEIKIISDDIRRFSHNLSSVVLEQYGFVFAVEELLLNLEELDNAFDFEFNYDSGKIDSKTIERELYFVCLELINNAIKHSSGNRVSVAFTASSSGYELRVDDNGEGYEFNRHKFPGLGLKSIDWRLKILSGELDVYNRDGLQIHRVRIPRC